MQESRRRGALSYQRRSERALGSVDKDSSMAKAERRLWEKGAVRAVGIQQAMVKDQDGKTHAGRGGERR